MSLTLNKSVGHTFKIISSLLNVNLYRYPTDMIEYISGNQF